jgi:hypothetical protein
MIEQSVAVSIVSSAITGLVMIVTNIMVNKTNVLNLKESLNEFKVNIKETIKTEKDHALEIGKQRIISVEKDVDEIFPRLRTAEQNTQKNCIVLTKLLQEHEKMICQKGVHQ